MKKKCIKCGKEFEAMQSFFKECPECFSGTKQKTNFLSTDLLLKTYYDAKDELLKEVFIGKPEEISKILAKDGLKTTQLRDFHRLISRACNKAALKDMANARPLLYECQRNLEYQLKRRIVPRSFGQFMKHHLALAEKDEKNLEGFFQHLESIVAYFPVK